MRSDLTPPDCKPCPVCGGKPSIAELTTVADGESKTYYQVLCTLEDCGRASVQHPDRAKAIKKWNRSPEVSDRHLWSLRGKWWQRAHGHRYIANTLWSLYSGDRHRPISNTAETRRIETVALVTGAAYHWGMAVELAAKGAVAVRQRRRPPLDRHLTVELLQEAVPRDLSATELDLAQRLISAINWWGRYPFPQRAVDLADKVPRKRSGRPRREVSHELKTSDPKAIEKLLDDLGLTPFGCGYTRFYADWDTKAKTIVLPILESAIREFHAPPHSFARVDYFHPEVALRIWDRWSVYSLVLVPDTSDDAAIRINSTDGTSAPVYLSDITSNLVSLALRTFLRHVRSARTNESPP